MTRFTVLLAGLILLLFAPGGRAQRLGEDDERWIEQYMQRREARAPVVGGRPLSFAELSALRGERVRIELADGRQRRGYVEQADAGRVTLRVALAGGNFSFSIDRAQVRSIRLEAPR